MTDYTKILNDINYLIEEFEEGYLNPYELVSKIKDLTNN